MKKLVTLKENDRVLVVAPGYSSLPDKIRDGVDYLNSWKLQVIAPKELVEPYYFHANTDQKRFAYLKQAIQNKNSRCIWALRGGYGSNRLIPELLKLKAPKESKLFVGISDVTSLHWFFGEHWKWASLHGPLLDRLGEKNLPASIVAETKAIVFGQTQEALHTELKPLNKIANQRKVFRGTLSGGNLTTLCSSLGTKMKMNPKGDLVFFEDIGERGYRVDRMLEQFRQARFFQKCAGVVFGHFIKGEEPSDSNLDYTEFALERFAQGVDIPVWSGLKAGHGAEQRPLVFGAQGEISKNNLKLIWKTK